MVEGLEVIPVESLAQAVAFFAGEIDLFPAPSRLEELFEEFSVYDVDFGDVRGRRRAAGIGFDPAAWQNLQSAAPPERPDHVIHLHLVQQPIDLPLQHAAVP